MVKTSLAKIIEEEVAGFKEQVKLVEGGYRSKYSLVLSENLLAHIMPKMDAAISDEDAKKNAGLLIEYFGTNNHVVDNRLKRDVDARAIFVRLNDIGLLRVEREDGPFLIFGKDGGMYQKNWSLHYWVWDYRNIFEALKDKQEEQADEFGIYSHLSDDTWARGKS